MNLERYDSTQMRRIELLLEKLLAIFEGKIEKSNNIYCEIKKVLKEIKKDNNELKGADFLG